jgi:hypothetical protein
MDVAGGEGRRAARAAAMSSAARQCAERPPLLSAWPRPPAVVPPAAEPPGTLWTTTLTMASTTPKQAPKTARRPPRRSRRRFAPQRRFAAIRERLKKDLRRSDRSARPRQRRRSLLNGGGQMPQVATTGSHLAELRLGHEGDASTLLHGSTRSTSSSPARSPCGFYPGAPRDGGQLPAARQPPPGATSTCRLLLPNDEPARLRC